MLLFIRCLNRIRKYPYIIFIENDPLKIKLLISSSILVCLEYCIWIINFIIFIVSRFHKKDAVLALTVFLSIIRIMICQDKQPLIGIIMNIICFLVFICFICNNSKLSASAILNFIKIPCNKFHGFRCCSVQFFH